MRRDDAVGCKDDVDRVERSDEVENRCVLILPRKLFVLLYN